MDAVLITEPNLEPITLDELKVHLRYDEDDTEDDLLNGLIKTARERVEDITRRAILTQTWDYFLQDWPDYNFIKLPLGNLQNVPAIQYVRWKDKDATESTLTVTTDYLWQMNGHQYGRVVLPYSKSWPVDVLYPSNPITVRFVCGWASVALVPSQIKSAIKMICSELHENRGESVLGQIVSENKTIERLLYSLRLWEEF